jgi:hypothetical protein
MKFIESLVADRTPSRVALRMFVFAVMLPLLLVAGAFVLICFTVGQTVITLISLGEFAITGDAYFQWFWNWCD